MTKKNAVADHVKLKSFEEMFKSSDSKNVKKENDIVYLPIEVLKPFQEHPFKSYSDEKMNEMVESIKQNGILSPVIVRSLSEETYEIIAGHNRVTGARKAKLGEVPTIIVDVDDDTATIMMVESNLNQRESILPSERAMAYKLQLESLKRQGKRTDLTSRQVDEKLSVEVVAEQNNSSAKQVHRFIRLTELIPELSDLLDESKLKFTFAVDLSYLSQSHQLKVYELLGDKKYKLSTQNVNKMKSFSKVNSLNNEIISELMLVQQVSKQKTDYKQVDKTIKRFKLPKDRAVNIIEKALEMYSKTEEFRKEIDGDGEEAG